MVEKWVADFETTCDPQDCRVWLWGAVNIDDPTKFVHGTNIKNFIQWCQSKKNAKVWFHNLKFDSQFIMSWLLNNGYKWDRSRTIPSKSFTSLITPKGEYFSIKIVFKREKDGHLTSVSFYDSMKLLNMSVEKIAREFRLITPKLTIDYKAPRPEGYKPSVQEVHYVHGDCLIVAQALKKLFDFGVDGITIGQCALKDFKKRVRASSIFYPKIPEEAEKDIRRGYRGGYTYLNPKYADRELGAGFCLDCNSMYPHQLLNVKLPYGEPRFVKGKCEASVIYPLYIQNISVVCDLKPGKTPFIRSKNSQFFEYFNYVESTQGEWINLILTNMEMEMLFENYDVREIQYHSGWLFKGNSGIFSSYVNSWAESKMQAKEQENYAQYTISKMFLNSLVGKFGARSTGRVCEPMLDEDGVVQFTTTTAGKRSVMYSPVSLFVCAYARCDMLHTIEKLRDYGWKKYGRDVFIYADTDSMFTNLPLEDLAEIGEIIELDDAKIGAWKLDKVFAKAKFLHAKCYMTMDNAGVPHATIAGMPKSVSDHIRFDEFRPGFSTQDWKSDPERAAIEGRLTARRVKGGVILEPVDFTIN